MYDIDRIMDMLDSNNTIKMQEKGIRLAKNIKSINVFILPMHSGYNKNIWENCAKILANKTDEELSPYLTNLLEWTEDLNWPGAIIILERMKKFSKTRELAYNVEEFVNVANTRGEYREIWLTYLSELLDNKKLREELPKETLDILKTYYYNEEDFVNSYIFYSKILYDTQEDEYITKDECVRKLDKLNEKYKSQEYYEKLLNKIMDNDNLEIALRAAKDSLKYNLNIEKATKILNKSSEK